MLVKKVIINGKVSQFQGKNQELSSVHKKQLPSILNQNKIWKSKNNSRILAVLFYSTYFYKDFLV